VMALIIMERTPADEVSRFILGKFNTPAAHQRHQIGLAPNVIQVGFRNLPGHEQVFSGLYVFF
ncbi:MAG: hypothetical protein WCJ07_08220, partial [Verrucomicrobiota bacterium]